MLREDDTWPPKAAILLVDDEPSNRLALRAILEELGQTVVEACSGEEALKQLPGQDYAVILLDVQMQGLGGFETAKLIRERERSRHTPIIFITAFDSPAKQIEEAYMLGAVDYLVKPLVPVILRAKVLAFVELFQKTEHIRRLEQERYEQKLAVAQMRTERKQAKQLELLWEAASVLLTTSEPDAMLRGLFAKIAPHFGLDTYFNFMVNEAGDALRLESCAGIPDETARSLSRLEFGQAVCGTVAVQRTPIVATFIQESDDPKVQLVKSFGIRAYACHPLLAEGQLLGTLSFASHTRDQFDADELEFLRTLNHYVTVAYERLRLVKELKLAGDRKDQFLAMLAHELRNPLAPLRNALQVLRLRAKDAATVEEVSQMMDRQVKHLSHLVDELLDVSRLMRGKVALKTERLDLARLVQTVAHDYRAALEAAGLAVELDVPGPPVWVMGDPTRLTQTLENLLENAVKFTPAGGKVRIQVSVSDADRTAVLLVRDTGVGIEPEMLPRLFETFSQADRSLDRTNGGLGLGLSVVKGLVELHGGRIEAKSDGPGKGAEFTVWLPKEEELPALLPGEPPEAPKLLSKQLRVLVVEDNRDAAESLRMLLELYGFRVHVAYTGPDGVALAKREHPDVVVCDIGLPGMDGFAVADALRKNGRLASARLIAVTGYGQEEDKRRALQAGFDAHLVKPADPHKLLALLAPTPL